MTRQKGPPSESSFLQRALSCQKLLTLPEGDKDQAQDTVLKQRIWWLPGAVFQMASVNTCVLLRNCWVLPTVLGKQTILVVEGFFFFLLLFYIPRISCFLFISSFHSVWSRSLQLAAQGLIMAADLFGLAQTGLKLYVKLVANV